MAIQVRIPTPLRKFTGGNDTVEASGGTIGEVLSGLCGQYGEFKTRLFKEDGSLNRFVNIFVNDEDIRFQNNLDTPVKEGDEVSIIQAVAGGGWKLI
jgi:MoaD family protein